MSTGTVLIAGATGLLGMEVARLLRSSGRPVRAVVRPGSDALRTRVLVSLEADLIVADLKDPESLSRACSGIDAVVSTATAMRSRREGDSLESVDGRGQLSLVEAAAREGVRRFVFVSIPRLDVDFSLQRKKRAVEDALRSSGVAHTILQPATFMEVWLGRQAGFDLAGGQVKIFGDGDAPVSWISMGDVARFAVAAVDQGIHAVELPIGGPEALSPLQVVRMFESLARSRIDNIEFVSQDALRTRVATALDPVDEARAAISLAAAGGLIIDSKAAAAMRTWRAPTVHDHLISLYRQSSGQT